MVPAGILASVLAVVALAAPAPAVDDLSGPFRLPLKRNVKTIPTRRDGVDIPFTVFGKEMYYSTTISVGTPPQDLPVLFDTGSMGLWIADDGEHFNRSRSSTFRYARYENGNKVPWNFSYMKGFAHGYLARDTVSLGPFKQETMFNAAAEWHEGGLPGNNSGLMGFGWPREDLPEPFWYTAAKQWKDKRFGIYFGRADGHVQTVNDASPGGLLTLGGVEESLFTGNINYLPLLKGQHREYLFDTNWVVPTDEVRVNGKLVDVGPNYPAWADTGTTLIMGHRTHVAKMYEQVPGAQLDPNASAQENGMVDVYTFPCDADFELSFQFAGETYTIQRPGLVHVRRWDGACYGAVVGTNNDFWLLGDYFLKHVYTIHRVDPPGLAFAKLK